MCTAKVRITATVVLLVLSGLMGDRACSQPCGDFDASGEAGLSDLIKGIQYLWVTNSPPADFATADVDSHSLFTMSDILVLYDHLRYGSWVACPPTLPAVFLPESSTEFLQFTRDTFPPNRSYASVEIWITLDENLEYYQIPIAVRIDGQHPDSAKFFVAEPRGLRGGYNAAEGRLLLGLYPYVDDSWIDVLGPGKYLAGRLVLYTAPSANLRPLTFEYIQMPPMQDGENVNRPMLFSTYPTRIQRTPGGVRHVGCTGTTGNVDLEGIVDLTDLSQLVAYLTGAGVWLPSPEEANVNATGIVDLSDLSALVSYLTGGGVVLPACP